MTFIKYEKCSTSTDGVGTKSITCFRFERWSCHVTSQNYKGDGRRKTEDGGEGAMVVVCHMKMQLLKCRGSVGVSEISTVCRVDRWRFRHAVHWPPQMIFSLKFDDTRGSHHGHFIRPTPVRDSIVRVV